MRHMVCLQMEVEGTIGTHATYITWSAFTPTFGKWCLIVHECSWFIFCLGYQY